MKIFKLGSLKIHSFVLVTSAILFLLANFAYPWGSLDEAPYVNTHKYIDEVAYGALQKNTFVSENFPDIKNILFYEGINRKAQGRGPDSEGSTLYSEHYYNPITGEGNAPQAVKKYFIKLSEANMGINMGDGAKAAAWAAHFLADMFVPYHVVGMPASLAKIEYVGKG